MLVLFDEVSGVVQVSVETLKLFITEDQSSVELKDRDRHQIDNYARFMFCSNHLDGLPFDENERRFFTIVCQATETLDAHFYARFVEACHRRPRLPLRNRCYRQNDTKNGASGVSGGVNGAAPGMPARRGKV